MEILVVGYIVRLILVLKNIMMFSEFSKVYVNNTCADYENLKHLAKDGSIKDAL